MEICRSTLFHLEAGTRFVEKMRYLMWVKKRGTMKTKTYTTRRKSTICTKYGFFESIHHMQNVHNGLSSWHLREIFCSWLEMIFCPSLDCCELGLTMGQSFVDRTRTQIHSSDEYKEKHTRRNATTINMWLKFLGVCVTHPKVSNHHRSSQ